MNITGFLQSSELVVKKDWVLLQHLDIIIVLYFKDAEWDLSVSLHPVASQALRDLADSYSLVCSIPVISVSTHYLDIQDYTNTVTDLIFLYMSWAQVSYHIEPNLR